MRGQQYSNDYRSAILAIGRSRCEERWRDENSFNSHEKRSPGTTSITHLRRGMTRLQYISTSSLPSFPSFPFPSFPSFPSSPSSPSSPSLSFPSLSFPLFPLFPDYVQQNQQLQDEHSQNSYHIIVGAFIVTSLKFISCSLLVVLCFLPTILVFLSGLIFSLGGFYIIIVFKLIKGSIIINLNRYGTGVTCSI